MKEEKKLLKKAGTGNAFRVPEGYFEKLTQEIVNKLPPSEQTAFAAAADAPSLLSRIRPWLYMAAMFVGAALIIRIASPSASDKQQTTANNVPDEYIDEVLDVSGIDDYALYVYLTAADVETNQQSNSFEE